MIVTKIIDIISDVLKTRASEDTSAEDVPGWDSLKTLQIVMALEEAGCEIPLEKIADIKSVRDVLSFANTRNDVMNLVIYGAGGLGREVLALLRTSNTDGRWNFIGFIDDGIPSGTRVGDGAVLGGMDWLTSMEEPVAVVMGLAKPSIKASIYEKLSGISRVTFPVLIHPSAYVDPSAALAEGTVVSGYCSISVDTVSGICSFFNTGSQVGHDSVVGDFCSVMPSVNISGSVTIGARTLVGAGAKILQGLKVGTNVTVGIGSVVLSNVPDNCTVIGYPAKMLQKNRAEEL